MKTGKRGFVATAALAAVCAAIGSNYMLNVGPDPLGRFPVAAIDILDGLSRSLKCAPL